MCFFLISVQKFPNPSLPKSDWISSINVECGWGKKWDPPSVPGFSRSNSYLLLSILFTSLQTNWNNLRLLVNLINLGCLTHPLPCGTIEMGFEHLHWEPIQFGAHLRTVRLRVWMWAAHTGTHAALASLSWATITTHLILIW